MPEISGKVERLGLFIARSNVYASYNLCQSPTGTNGESPRDTEVDIYWCELGIGALDTSRSIRTPICE